MPVLINEIIIRAVIQDDSSKVEKLKEPGDEKELIISECVEQVLEILKEKEER